MVAAARFEEFHITVVVRSFEVLSKYVPMAVNCGLVPGATDEFAGVTAIDTSGFVTVRPAVPDTEPDVAVMVTVPGATPVANPDPLMVAIKLLVDCQFTELVRFCVEVSANVPVAVNC
jgi:hypothetical protein